MDKNNRQGSFTNPYVEALKEFIKKTIRDSSFFNLSPERQKEIAKSYIDKYKALHMDKLDKQERSL